MKQRTVKELSDIADYASKRQVDTIRNNKYWKLQDMLFWIGIESKCETKIAKGEVKK